MRDHQRQFIEFAIESEVLKFGAFTLKSGRISPYFFNAGLFNDGHRLARLGEFYAAAIVDSGISFDVLFGPAYKGIPLVSSVAIALYNRHSINKPWVFNRKEAKDHGEGGSLVGATLGGRVLIIDDVVTAGTAIRESFELIRKADAELAGVCVSIDRQERGQYGRSAVDEIRVSTGAPVITIATLAVLIDYLTLLPRYRETLEQVNAYRRQYGV